MDAAKIVVGEVERDRSRMIFDLLGKPVGKARESAHRHAHCEILPFRVRGTHVLMVGTAANCFHIAADTSSRRVPGLRLIGGPVNLVHHCIIHILAKGNLDCREIGLMCVSRDLRTANNALADIPYELRGPSCVASAHKIRDAEFGISVNRRPRPYITPPCGFLFRRCVLLFCANETPDFIALQALCLDAAYHSVVKIGTSGPDFSEQFDYGVLCRASDPDGSTDAHSFAKAFDDLDSLRCVKLIHNDHYA